MKRRDFIPLFGGAAGWPLATRAQQAKLPLIGYLSARSAEAEVLMLAAFREGLAATGHVEGRNVQIDFRVANDEIARLPARASIRMSRFEGKSRGLHTA